MAARSVAREGRVIVMEWLAQIADPATSWVLVGVFVTSAIAGSVVPVSSEVAVAGAAIAGVPITPLVLVATIGNVIGGCLNYVTGRLGAGWWRRWRAAREGAGAVTPPNGYTSALEVRAKAWIAQWGAPAMMLSWLPVVGDPLTVLAGVLGIAFAPFLFWVTIGKAVRYMVVVGATGAVTEAMRW